MAVKERRLAILRVSPVALVQSLVSGTGPWLVRDGLPADVRVERCAYDLGRDLFMLLLWSAEFELVAQGVAVPEVGPVEVTLLPAAVLGVSRRSVSGVGDGCRG